MEHVQDVRRVTPEGHGGRDGVAALRNWQRGLRINHIAHHRSAARYAMLGRAVGIAVVALSTVVGTAIFSTLSESPSTAARTVAGLLSVTAAVFAALQTFLGFPQRQAEHHAAAVRYGALRREIESALGLPPPEPELRQLLTDIRVRWDDIDATAPAVPQRIWRGAIDTVQAAEAARGRASGG